jgi:hypothetical protein
MTIPTDVPATEELRDQLAAERHALRLVARPDVRLALAALSQRWRANTPGRLDPSYARLSSSLDEIALFVALQVVAGDAHRPQVIEISAAPHRWFGTDVPGGRWGINNPDTLYFSVPVEPSSAYVLRGQPRATRPTDLNIGLQLSDVFQTVDHVGLRDLVRAEDGSYRVTVDAQPAQGRVNHLQIRDGADQVLIRTTLADWTRELPDRFSVQRVAGPLAAPPADDDALVVVLLERLERVITHTIAHLQEPIFRLPTNTLPGPGARGDKSGFLVTQRNALGHFRLGDREALIATVCPGGAGYAGFSVTDVWGVSPDSEHHQNSLNSQQATPNPDGTFTVVVSKRDPGVANWIDPGPLHEGIIMLRWQLLAATAGAREPEVESRVVARTALDAHLPAATARVTPGERAAQRAQRTVDFERRFTGRLGA